MPAAKIAVIYSSTYGHVRTLAEAIAEASKATGAQVDLFQFPEILSDEVLAKMHAAPKADYPIIKPDDLKNYDGFLFGIPTRYGRAVGAASAFFDATGGLWATGALFGKFAGIFTSSASQHGGQETTALTTLPFFAHHGISYVPIGFAASQLTDNTEIVGGSAYGAAAIAGGDGSRGLTEKELAIAAFQGKSFAEHVGTFVAGKSALAAAKEASQPIAAHAVPASAAATTSEAAPYELNDKDAAPAVTETAPTTGALTGAAPATTTSAPAPVAEAQPAEKSTPAASTPAPKPKKKGGFFGCCGSSSHYDD